MFCRRTEYVNYNMRMQLLKTVEVAVDGGEIVLVVPRAIFSNYENVLLCITQSIPYSADNESVYIQAGYSVGGSSPERYQIRDTNGNTVYSYQLRPRKLYRLIANQNEEGFVINPCNLEHNGTILARVAPTTPPANSGDAGKEGNA
ncbi:hypothetical protein [Enterocloster hominis (ex Hitch et al. 2024)]|uniref:Uncharacterized protein n=1 Tax=Enterocloster hominis (ex Hitch et al. 2024) TaxID=1917870 RepID=A0ABV1D2B0_9FIRM